MVQSLFRGMAQAIALTLLTTGAAQAQAQRTFVSTTGDDTNTASLCSAALPCRSFAAALTVTKPGGEIVPLTSGGYGAVTIGQSVQIAAPYGVYAAITAPSGPGVTVNASPTDTIVLKGLTINGLLSGAHGILASAFGTLHIESCIVTGFADIGIQVDVNSGNVYIKDSEVRNNGDAGIFIRAQGGSIRATLDNVRSEGNVQSGVIINDGASATISRSVAAGNGADGFLAYADFGAMSEINCDSCYASNNGAAGFRANGLAGGKPTVRIARSTATDNQTGFATSSTNGSPIVESLSGTNLVRGNTTNTSGTINAVTSP